MIIRLKTSMTKDAMSCYVSGTKLDTSKGEIDEGTAQRLVETGQAEIVSKAPAKPKAKPKPRTKPKAEKPKEKPVEPAKTDG